MQIAWRQRGDAAANFVFVLLMVTLFPFALGPDAAMLQKLGGGLLLLAIMLGQMLGFERLFAADFQNGTLDILVSSRLPLSLYALIKAKAQALTLLLPVWLLSPLLMLLLHIPFADMPNVLLALALSSLTIQYLGMLGAALALGAKQAGLLLPLMLIPFYIPVVIFAVSLASHGFDAEGRQAALFLCALFFLYVSILPFLTGAALRSAVESS